MDTGGGHVPQTPQVDKKPTLAEKLKALIPGFLKGEKGKGS